MSLFAFYYYRLNRDKAYLYYGIYTFIGFYLAVQHADDRFGLDVLRLPSFRRRYSLCFTHFL